MPWLQIDDDAMTRGRTLARLLDIPDAHGIGLCVALWDWALDMAPEGDLRGRIADESPASLCRAAVGWAGDAALLWVSYQRIGLIDASGRVKGLSRYDKVLRKRQRDRERVASGPSANRSESPRKTETETETEKELPLSATADLVVERVFAKYQQAAQSPRSKLDDKRRKLIRARLKDFSEADLCRALDGYARSPHHQGQNDRNTRYVTLELWFRDTAHVEAGMAMVPTPTTVPATAENIAVPPEWQ